MNYQIILKKPAKKFIDRLPADEKRRLIAAIEALPHTGGIKKFQGREDVFRLRVGSYRVLYTVDHDQLIVCIIGARKRGQIYNQ